MATLSFGGIAFSTTENLYRVRDDDPPRFNEALQCPPQMQPMFEKPSDSSGTHRTRMSFYGWEEYLRQLNGDKFEVAVAKGLAMFNDRGADPSAPFDTRDKMESLLFGRAWVLAIPAGVWGWHRVLTLNYAAGPPKGMPTYKENPLYVQKFTMICRKGAVTARQLYYPVVTRLPVFIKSNLLEPWSENMQTGDPPFGPTLMGEFMEDVFRTNRYGDYRDWM